MAYESQLKEGSQRWSPLQGVILTVLACAATTVLATPLLGYLDLANIVMLFLLTVLLVAVKLGRNQAILASVLSVLLFDVFFVPPRFSLEVANIQYLVTFAVMLATGLLTAHLAAGLREKAQDAERRERRTEALYQVARQLAGALAVEQIDELARAFVTTQLNAHAALLLPDELRRDLLQTAGTPGVSIEIHLARMAYQTGETVRSEAVRSQGDASLYLPLNASMRTRGVLALRFDDPYFDINSETLSLLEAMASLIAVALERLHYETVAKSSEVKMLTERLRGSILSALSHDLRTPLTAMVGLADSLSLIKPPLPPAALETAQALHEQAARLAGLVSNLLDMARLNAGTVTLRKEWQPLEEVIGASIKLLGAALARHPVKVGLPPDLPLLEFDAVLIERVFCNLLENSAKFAPADTPIAISATRQGDWVAITVCDSGIGFPPGCTDALFDMFARAPQRSGTPGTGLGLAICKAIVEAHHGNIHAENRADIAGGCVTFRLPVGDPPIIEEEKP